MSRYRSCCFTYNNYTEESIKNILAFPDLKYVIMGKEIAPTTGTPHLQGYAEFDRQVQLKDLQPVFGHITRNKGNAKQNIAYCSKSGDVITFGEPKQQGKRTDLEDVAEMVKEKKSMTEIALAHPIAIIKYGRGIENCAALMHATQRDKNIELVVVYIYGLAGVGKTKLIQDKLAGCSDVYWKDDSKWWGGYRGQSIVVIDDFRLEGYWSLPTCLRVFNRAPLMVEAKGVQVQLSASTFYITTDRAPDKWGLKGNDYAQLRRRLSAVIELRANGELIQHEQKCTEVGGNNKPPLLIEESEM